MSTPEGHALTTLTTRKTEVTPGPATPMALASDDRKAPPPTSRRDMAIGLVYAVAAVPAYLLLPGGHPFLLWPALTAFAVYQLAGIVRLPAGGDWYASFVQPVFVVLVFALPLNMVPLVIPLAVLGAGTVVRYRAVAPRRILVALADSWYALPPVVILALLAPGPAEWQHWPVYALAFATGIVFIDAVALVRWPGSGYQPIAPFVDVMLTPIGIAAAVGAAQAPAAPAAVLLGLSGMMALVTRERTGRIEYQQRALRDPLTHLANRSLFDELLETASRRCARTGSSAALLLLDLDDFKAINDEHGHQVGDAVLKWVADRLRTSVREVDAVSRFGGDEFAVLLSDPSNVADGERVAQTLVDALSEPLELEDVGEIHVRVSIGVGAVGNGHTPEQAFGLADRYLYEVKRAAKTRARSSEQDPG
jgi:diguanylate cyclase (GGDEF)-like protein